MTPVLAQAEIDVAHAPADRERGEKLRTVLRVASGNFLEMYDFFVFAYYAAAIGKTFFPQGDETAQLMASLMAFGAGFLMRPIGALVLGSYIDRVGRRRGLIVTLGLMAVGTASIALLPGYATIGLVAPVVVVLGRLVQGLSAGVELGGVSIYLAEMATPGHKGFYVAWQSGSQQVAVALVAILGLLLAQSLSPDQLVSWGWRLPLLVGCMIIPLIFLLRRGLKETDEFLARPSRPTIRQILSTIAANWQVVLTGVLLTMMTTVSFYLITAYTPTYGKTVLKLDGSLVLVVTLCVALSNLFWLPVMGALSDRVGRRPLLIVFTALAVLTVYPAMLWLVDGPSFTKLLIVELWLSFLYGSYNGAMVVHLTEIMPASVRTTGFSLAYSLATTLGGFTPAIAMGLIEATNDKAAPGIWMSTAAMAGLLAAVYGRRSKEA